MLSTLLSQTSAVLSRLFVFASFVPTLVFAFVNGCLLSLWLPEFRDWARPQVHGTEVAFDVAASIIGIAVVAYILFALNNSLRVFLETAAFLPPKVREALCASEEVRLQRITGNYLNAMNERMRMERLRGRDRRLLEAVDAGAGVQSNSYDPDGKAGRALRILEKKSFRNRLISSEEMKETIQTVADELRVNNKAIGPPHLDEAHLLLLKLQDYAVDRWKSEEIEHFNHRQFQFGALTPKPTRLGNVADSVQGYTLSRYNLNIEALWTRFFSVMQQKKDAFPAIDEVKTQLDFLVTCTWLSALSCLCWAVTLVASGHSIRDFLLVAMLGPLVTYLLYDFAVRTYTVFADVLRSAIDQYRFAILESMALPLPGGLGEERQIWGEVSALIGKGGEYLEISYRLDRGAGRPQ